MSDQEMKIQSAIWELVATEVDYIRALQTVTNVNINLIFLTFFFARVES